MSTSYGLLCEVHNAATGTIAQWEQPVLDAWVARDVFAAARRVQRAAHGSVELSIFGVEEGTTLDNWMREHAGCPQNRVAVVSEYGDIEGITARLEQTREPDADEIVKAALTELGFPADSIERTTPAIVDRLVKGRVLSYYKQPDRTRGVVL